MLILFLGCLLLTEKNLLSTLQFPTNQTTYKTEVPVDFTVTAPESWATYATRLVRNRPLCWRSEVHRGLLGFQTSNQLYCGQNRVIFLRAQDKLLY